jgi:hypothetical protein
MGCGASAQSRYQDKSDQPTIRDDATKTGNPKIISFAQAPQQVTEHCRDTEHQQPWCTGSTTNDVISYLKERQETNQTGATSKGSPCHLDLAVISKQGRRLSTFFENAGDIQEYKPHVDFLRTISSPDTALDNYIQVIINEVVRIVDADRCSVFFVDDVLKEVWCVGSLDMESFKMPWDQGIVGLVAHDGKLLNLADAHDHQAFDSTVEKLTGYAVHSMLSLPIKHMVDDTRTIGVIQVLNKKSTNLNIERSESKWSTAATKSSAGSVDVIEISSHSSFQHQISGQTTRSVFSEQDVIELQKIAMLCSDSFHRQRWQALERGNACSDKEAQSVIMAHGKSLTSRLKSVKRRSNLPLDPVNGSLLREHSATSQGSEVASELTILHWPCETSPILSDALHSLNFNALSHTHDHLIKMVPDIMKQANCIESCNINRDHLRNWAGTVKRSYRDNPFHSWFHGFSVYQMCYYQLFNSTISACMRHLDVFGLLVAALCHDVDHPGCTNSYLINVEDQLALRYNDNSVLENHHASTACELMRGKDTGIAAGLARSSQQMLRRIIIKCILDTDLTFHHQLCNKIQAAPRILQDNAARQEEVSPETVEMLLSSCIHAADLSAQVLPWAVASQWEARISREFVNQAAKEIEVGLSPAPFMQFSFDDLKQRGKLQKDFIDFVLTPLWGPYADMVLEFHPCFDNLIANRKQYDYRSIHGKDEGQHSEVSQ